MRCSIYEKMHTSVMFNVDELCIHDKGIHITSARYKAGTSDSSISFTSHGKTQHGTYLQMVINLSTGNYSYHTHDVT